MKRFAYPTFAAGIFALLSTALASTAYADGTPGAFAAPKPFTWTGPYIGAHAGYAWQDGSVLYDNEGHSPADPQLNSPLDLGSGIAGVHGGYRVQWGQFVVGVAGDYSWLSEGSDDATNDAAGEDPEFIHAEAEYLASLRATLGYAVGNVLVFGTAGVGFTEFELSVTDPDSSSLPFKSASLDAQGLVYGGGVEFKLTEAVSLGALYLHYDVGETYTFKRGSVSGFNDADDGDFVKFDDIDVVRVSLNIQLNSVLTSFNAGW